MKTNTVAVDIYKDMLEKLKYHKEVIMHAFIKHGYYPSNEEVTAAVQKVNARLSLFETYISAPGSYFNYTEINYCFEMIAKDIEILYKVVESILLNEFSMLKLSVESTLSELENKAKYFAMRRKEELNSTALGKTVFFQANNWKVKTLDQLFIIDLGTVELIEGTNIACIANVNDIEEDKISFKFECADSSKSFYAHPYNFNYVSYQVPGTLGINNHEIEIGTNLIINDDIELDYEMLPDCTYELAGGKNYMKITNKKTKVQSIHEIPFINGNSFYVMEDCYIEFFVVDGVDSLLEYSFNIAPEHTNFSLQNGYIKIDKPVKRIYMEAQVGLVFSFGLERGKIFAEVKDVISTSNKSILYTGHKDITDFVLREYVKSNTIKFNLKIYIDSLMTDITNSIESIVIKELD